jgi:hypothetical protein
MLGNLRERISVLYPVGYITTIMLAVMTSIVVFCGAIIAAWLAWAWIPTTALVPVA